VIFPPFPLLLVIVPTITACHIPVHKLADSNRDNYTGTYWALGCIPSRCKGSCRPLSSTRPARSILVPDRCRCKRSEAHRSCRPENYSIRLWDIHHDSRNRLLLHFSPRRGRTRKILGRRLVRPVSMQRGQIASIIFLFSQISPKIIINFLPFNL
jgi:hypothetical protein